MRRSPRRPGAGRAADGAVDWAEVRARLARATAATEAALDPDPERVRALLDARATRLAQPLAAEDAAGAGAEVLVFALGRERYAVPAAFVREVVRLTDYAPVPGTPRHFVGVTHHRGEVVAVVDLGALLGAAAPGITDRARLVVLGARQAEVGLVADALVDVTRVRDAALRPSPAEHAAGGRGLVRGVAPDGAAVLDVEALLADPRMTVDHRGRAAPAGEEGR